MYFIYMDEAGISAVEPVSVVVGVIVHADRHWRAASKLLEEIKDFHVPKDIREGFHFHAKQIMPGFRDLEASWSQNARAAFIADVAAIPRKLKMAVSIGKVRRDSGGYVDGKLKKFEMQHIQAFWHAVLRANKFVRDWGEDGEIATIVAENVPKMQRFLVKTLEMKPPNLSLSDHIVLTKIERETGVITQSIAPPIDRIIDTPHFVAKNEAPLLQIADACAYVFRRYLAQKSHGEWMVTHMLGHMLEWEDWQGPSSEMVFKFDPRHQFPR